MTKFLVTQNQNEIINISRVTSIKTNNNSIIADVPLCVGKEIGVYESKGEAENEFNRIMSEIVNGVEMIWLN